MKATLLLKQNIDHLLKRRGQTRREMAMWTLQTVEATRADSWASHLFGKAGYHTKHIPSEYLGRIASFFGLQVYQLFQPGISPLTERRSGADRRTTGDRRLSARARGVTTPRLSVSVSAEDEVVLADLRELSYEDYQRVKGWIAVARLARSSGQETAPPPVPRASDQPPPAPAARSRKTRKKTTPPK